MTLHIANPEGAMPAQLLSSCVCAGLAWQCHDSLEQAATVWRMLESASQPKVFQTHAWISTWWNCLGAAGDARPRIVVGLLAGKPVVLVPLALRQRYGVRQVGWLGGNWSDYNAPVFTGDFATLVGAASGAAAARRLKQLWTEIATAAGGADYIELPRHAPAVNGGQPNPLFDPAAPPEDNAAHVLDLTGSEAEVMTALHGPKTWKGFNRKEKKLASLGALAFTEVTDAAAKARTVEGMLLWKRQELHERGASNPFTAAANVAFLADVARQGPHLARVFALTLDDTPVATALCLADRENLLLYQTAYDREYARMSPGALLFHKLIALAAREGYATFDLAFGDDAYKANLCNRTVTLTHASIALTARGALACLAASARVAGRRTVKHNPALLRLALKANRMLGKAGTAPT
jgi:CelD/BcsL family acetyltransferase involved in cellulose biosynthesis